MSPAHRSAPLTARMITSAWMAWLRAVLSGSQELASPAVLG
jgi:hypothetical protein